MKKMLSVALAATLAGGSLMAQAYDQGDWILRAGAVTVSPDASSDNIVLPGVPTLEADVDDSTQLSIIPVWMMTEQFGLELLAATPFDHDITVGGKGVKLDAGSAKQLPPTLSVQWYPRGGQQGWQPYIGIGLNYTVFFDENVDGQLKGALGSILGATDADLSLDSSVGLAGQIGVDVPLGEHWAVNAGIWYIDISTTAKLKARLPDSTATVKFDVDVNPWVYNIGVAYKF